MVVTCIRCSRIDPASLEKSKVYKILALHAHVFYNAACGMRKDILLYNIHVIRAVARCRFTLHDAMQIVEQLEKKRIRG